MKKLTEIIRHATINRATILGYALCIVGLVAITNINSNSSFIYLVRSVIIVLLFVLSGVYILTDTKNVKRTYDVYEMTKAHIKKHKSLNEKFVAKYASNYCDRQGVYMAAKELGHIADYKKALKGKKVIIPNF